MEKKLHFAPHNNLRSVPKLAWVFALVLLGITTGAQFHAAAPNADNMSPREKALQAQLDHMERMLGDLQQNIAHQNDQIVGLQDFLTSIPQQFDRINHAFKKMPQVFARQSMEMFGALITVLTTLVLLRQIYDFVVQQTIPCILQNR